MSRGVKGLRKAAMTKRITAAKKADSTPAKKPRKAYPSTEERIALADVQIKRLTKINESRRALIEKFEAALSARKAAQVKSTAALEKAKTKRELLIAAKNKPIKEPKPKESKPKLLSKKPKVQPAKLLAKARTTKEKPVKAIKPMLTPEELKVFRVELMAKARAAKNVKRGK